MDNVIVNLIAKELGLPNSSVRNTIQLLKDGSTIPFISRYRKELTGSLDEVAVMNISKSLKKYEELIQRKESILASIDEQGKLTPELKQKIEASFDHNEIEDLYLPYKRKKRTRADMAREKGLEGLAKIIMSQKNQDIVQIADKYINDDVHTIDEAINGATDIIAEWISENPWIREKLRAQCRRYGYIHSEVLNTKKETGIKYKDYFQFQEPINRCPSHRYLAIMRGEEEGFLKVNVNIDTDKALNLIHSSYIKFNSSEAPYIEKAIEDAYKRLIFPSIENQIKNEFKILADEEAIIVFAENLQQLLLSPPLGQKKVLAIDPGFRTGCKLVCLDENGSLLYYETIFPFASLQKKSEAEFTLQSLCSKHQIQVIAIGNGTASRETRDFVESISFESPPEIFIVSESGASIYSASEVAREEFPHLDLTVRGAVSIGRRLMDPLAELVKIDAKSIGVGQYQHDVNQGKLKEALDMTVVSCVNKVGVNLNTASKHILTYISGLGPGLAKNIIDHRNSIGNFTDRKQLKKVPRLGEKAFEQCAGFLRIKDGINILDNTGVHPESYNIVEQMSKDAKVNVNQFVQDKIIRKSVQINHYITEKTGLPTLEDIFKELDKPGLDPRGEVTSFHFDNRLKSIEDLKEGMIIPGIITNLTNFGAFADIGVKQDGLIHISQITDKFIKSPSEVLKLQQIVNVKVLEVDINRKRVNLSMLIDN